MTHQPTPVRRHVEVWWCPYHQEPHIGAEGDWTPEHHAQMVLMTARPGRTRNDTMAMATQPATQEG